MCISLVLIIKAAITPGTHPTMVRMVVMTIDPHPLSSTAKGGKITHRITRQILMVPFHFQNTEF